VTDRWANASLLWRIFVVNAAIWAIALALIAWTPITVHRVATSSEVLVLAVVLVVMLAVDLVLLRRVLGPLRGLVAVMGTVDPDHPGRRAEFASSGREVDALAEALNSMLDRLEDERRESGRRALMAQESERARVARELHDEIGQTLTAVALRAERAAASDGEQRETLQEITASVAQSLDDVRRIGHRLRPEALDDLGLVNALIALASRIGQQSGIPVRRELDGGLPPLAPESELVIYRVAQEALTNALRHSGATTLSLALRQVDDHVALTVSDDGHGLPATRRETGIRGMRERAMLIEAELEITSSPGRGTEVRLSVPVRA
jgi:two-component system, NarL family, sensor histidine kinase UhpB